jgi:peptidoglycan/LPS O-acetylase OafA/YrhL
MNHSREGKGLGAARQSARLDWLDALRGWAVLGVVLVHSAQLAPSEGPEAKIAAAGQYGVQLFFIVSALTISMTYESHIARYGTNFRSQVAWFTKRFFRIAPLYYLAAVLYPIEQYAIYEFSRHRYGGLVHVPDVIANMLFLHTWIPSANNSVVPGGWSIGVEMFFYTLVPFCWMVVPIRRRVRVLCLSAIGFLIVTEFVSKVLTGSFFIGDNTYLYYWFPAQAPVLTIGLVFYFLYKSQLRSPSGSTPTIIWLGGFLIFFLTGIYLGTWKDIAPVLTPTILAVAYICAILGLRDWLRYIVVSKLLTFLGRISYGVYIYHFVVLDLLRAAVRTFHFDRSGPFALPLFFVTAIVATSGIALISKWVIEDPGIAYGHRLSRSIASGASAARSSEG